MVREINRRRVFQTDNLGYIFEGILSFVITSVKGEFEL